ncbi:MAG: hypothetical protein AABW65_03215 [Nanoarchaeota archaeon]
MWFQKNSEIYKSYTFLESLSIIKKPSLGSGADLLSHKGKEYLIMYTEYGEPRLIGMVKKICRNNSNPCNVIKILEYNKMPSEIRVEINSLLAPFWSDKNLEDIIKKSLNS